MTAAALALPHAFPPAEAAPRAASPWMVSPAVDLTVFVGITLSTFLAWIASDLLHVNGQYVLFAAAIANGPHLISTWTRVYLHGTERFARPFHYWVVPAIAAAYAIACRTVLGDLGQKLVTTTLFYWASWHFVAQSWGVLRLYQRRHGAAFFPEARLEKALIFLTALFFVLHRLFTGPWELFATPVFHQRPPAWLVNGLGALIVALSFVYLGALVRARRAGRNTPWVRPFYLAMNAVGFGVPYLVIKDGTSAFAAAAFWHAVQYIAIVWLWNRRHHAGAGRNADLLVARVSQPGRTWAYIGLLTACAAGVYAVTAVFWFSLGKTTFMEWGLTMWTALTLGHYYLDGVIWKTKRYDLRPLST